MASLDDYLEKALREGHLQIIQKGKAERILYVASGHTEKWSDPEEKVRAAFYAELIYKYEYKPQRIGVEVTVPRRTPSDSADLVVYEDESLTKPFIVIENKKDGVSDSEFNQAIEQACGNRASLGAIYSGIVAGSTRRFLNFTGTGAQERKRNIVVEASVLARVVEHLESICLSRTDLDTKGVAFEEFMGGFFKGDFGQYFTPRELIAFCVQMLDPSPDEWIIDPACGSGGFLLYALDHIRTKADAAYPHHASNPHEAKEHFRYWHDFAEKNLYGLEINDELTRVAIVLPDGILTNSSLQGVRDWLLEKFQLLAVVSLPQFAFSHYDAGVKASIVFLRKLNDSETVADETPIFMALAENIGYDATGRKTFVITVEAETPEKEKIERQASDLFEYRVYYEWSTANPKKPGWSEYRREVLPGTGLVAEYRAFCKEPERFFV